MVKYIFLLAVFMSALGCNQDIIYQQKYKIDEQWAYDQPLAYTFEIIDTTNSYNINLNINHESNFKFQNIYTKVTTVFPDNSKSTQILSLELADDNDYWIGKCNNKQCNIAIPLISNMYFSQLGIYKILFEQNSRFDTLRGINSMELSIHKRSNS